MGNEKHFVFAQAAYHQNKSTEVSDHISFRWQHRHVFPLRIHSFIYHHDNTSTSLVNHSSTIHLPANPFVKFIHSSIPSFIQSP